MTPHKYWRFRITENNGADTVVFSNFTLSLAPFTENIAQLYANASLQRAGTYTHQGLTGDVHYGVWSGVMPSETTQYSLMFREPEMIGAYSFQASGGTAPKSWLLEYSDDDAIWHIAHIEYGQTNWQANENRHFETQLYELSLSVNGSNAAPYFNAFIHDTGGNLILKKQVFNGETSILMPDNKPVSVTITQEFGAMWQAGHYYTQGVLVIPSSVTIHPYYYRNRKSGISQTFEPNWSNDPQILNYDSGCIWELVERLNQPITQSPLIPLKIP